MNEQTAICHLCHSEMSADEYDEWHFWIGRYKPQAKPEHYRCSKEQEKNIKK